jgi:hypothetical protein
MKRVPRVMRVLSLAALAAVAACGDSSSSYKGPPLTLALKGVPPVAVGYNEALAVPFTVVETNTGAPAVVNTVVTFSVNDKGAKVSKSAKSDDAGIVTATLTGGSTDATLKLTAKTPGAADLVLDVWVRSAPRGAVEIHVTPGAGHIPVVRAELSLYATLPPASPPDCINLRTVTTLPTTPLVNTMTTLPGAYTFPDITAGMMVLPYVRGYSASNTLVAIGCTAAAKVTGGAPTVFDFNLEQLPSVLDGDYDVLASIDVGSALPEPFGTDMATLTGVLQNPAGVLAYYMLKAIDDSALHPGLLSNATLADLLDDTVSNPTWSLIWPFIDTLLQQPATQSAYKNMKDTGAVMDALLHSFEVGLRLKLARVGNSSSFNVDETWNAVVLTWALGCTTGGDLGCARRALTLADNSMSPVTVHYSAVMTPAPDSSSTERFLISGAPHNLSVRYGTLLLLSLQKMVYPSLCADCTSLGGVLAYLFDCGKVGQVLYDNLLVPGLGTHILSGKEQGAGFCTSALSLAADLIDQQIQGLGNDTTQLQTPQNATFYLVDSNGDLKADQVRDLHMDLQWDSGYALSPSVGHGRRAATNCTGDNSCTAGVESCQPVPHYLQIKAIEMTCLHWVGTTPGGSACGDNSQCRSGICVKVTGASSGTCYAACQDNGDCGAITGAVCEPDRVSIDLNASVAGLGKAPAAGCIRQ